jgi:hypothetical protein
MHLNPASNPNETITVENAPGRMVELRIGRTASRSVRLSAEEAPTGGGAAGRDGGKSLTPWYESASLMTLLAAIVGAMIAAGAALLTAWFGKWLERRSLAQDLKVAFRGEINAIRIALRADTRAGYAAYTYPTIGGVELHQPSYPRTIYQNHANVIGGLRDRELVTHIANLYSHLQRAEEMGKRFHSISTRDREAAKPYLVLLASCFKIAVLVDVRLTEETKKLLEEKIKMTLAGMDANDLNLAESVLAELNGDPVEDSSDHPTPPG